MVTSYKTAQVGYETDEERIARLEKMVATTQLRLALETEEKLRDYLIWIEIGIL